MSHTHTPPDEVIEAIEDGTARVTRRIEFYEYDTVTPWVPPGEPDGMLSPRLLAEGSITLDANRDERRMLECALDNHDRLLYPDPRMGLWYDKVLKVYKGVHYPRLADMGYTSDVWETQVGEFYIDKMDFESFPNTVRISARDPVKRMLLSKIPQTETFDAAYKLGDLVKYLAINSGIRADKIHVPDDTPELGKNLTYDRGTSRWEIAKTAADGKRYQVYFDHAGYLILSLYADPLKDAPRFVFKTGKKGNLTKVSQSVSDSRLFNIIMVQGESSGTDLPPFFEARNTEPSSPTSIQNIGERAAPLLTYATVTTQAEAREKAKDELSRAALDSYELRFGSISYPWIEVGVVGKISEPDALVGAPERYLLDSATLTLGPGPMELTAKRITIVGDPEEQAAYELALATEVLGGV